jgi:hypothetical protein
MFDPISASAAQSLIGAINRAEAPAGTDAAESRQNLPVGEAANVNASPDTRESFVPARVERAGRAENEAVTSERPIRPPYLPVGGADLAAEPAPSTSASEDVAEEAAKQISEQNEFSASAETTETMQARVRKVYDLPE